MIFRCRDTTICAILRIGTSSPLFWTTILRALDLDVPCSELSELVYSDSIISNNEESIQLATCIVAIQRENSC